MKNDFIKEGIKISVPPTILYSVVAKIPDVRRTITAEFKRPGDLIYLVGQTFDELGGSEFYQLFGELGAHVPIVRPELAARVYGKMQQAHEQAWLHSAHDISDGGLAVALAESAFGGELGALVNIPQTDLSLPAFLFSESHSRFVVTVSSQQQKEFEALFGEDALLLGQVVEEPVLVIQRQNKKLIQAPLNEIYKAWSMGLSF